jgi:hypothetical protein
MPVLTFKVDPYSAQRIRANARAAKSSVSAYLRKVALGGGGSKPTKVVRRKHPVSGLPYNAAGAGPIVTDEEIRAALADFP